VVEHLLDRQLPGGARLDRLHQGGDHRRHVPIEDVLEVDNGRAAPDDLVTDLGKEKRGCG
jgi:hypothetical protein